MEVDSILRATIALAEREGRTEHARRLADLAGAAALFVLVEDTELGVLLPAPGYPTTLPGGRVWRELIAACASPGLHRGRVPAADSRPRETAIACSAGGAALVFVGADTDEGVVREAMSVLPGVAAGLRSEQDVVIATGALRTAQDYAREAEELARVLDSTRAELESKARSLDEARVRAEKAVRAKDEFLAVLGHELRNPLAPIATALELMRIEGVATRHQEVMERHVGHLLRLVDDLLDIARIARGDIELRRQRIELAELAERAVEMAGRLFEQKRQTLHLDIAPQGLAVDADPHRLVQVLVNLLTNASRYSAAETAIRLAAAHEGDRIRLRVADEGIGIEPAMLESIFETFSQDRSASAESLQGLGLGLAIVRNLVTLHGGTVRAFSAGRGKGSEFVVELPPSEDSDVEVAAPPAALPTDRSAAAGPRARILVVDDNADAAELLCQVLETVGYEVRGAGDGPKALAVAHDFQPTIALLDLGLPVMDGFELAGRLLAGDRTGALQLVAITGYGQRSDRQRSNAAGFSVHLVKPVQLERLLAVIGELVEKAEGAR